MRLSPQVLCGFIIGVFAVVAVPVSVGAETATFYKTIPETLYSMHAWGPNQGPEYGWGIWNGFSMSGIYTQIIYRASAVKGNGASACGSTVNVGESVNFTFEPRSYADIYWVGSGYANDTPYGDWTQGAAAPSADSMIQPKNLAYLQPDWRGWGSREHYISLSVNPPAQWLSVPGGVFSCGAAAGDGSRSCTAVAAGTSNTSFNFEATYGYFHKRFIDPIFNPCPWAYACWDTDLYTEPDRVRYTLQVPAQVISCPVTVVAPIPANTAPQVPVISSVGQCQVGSSHNITMQSSDKEGNSVRYEIDWDNNRTVDQIVPASGYTPSGVVKNASRVFSMADSKIVNVRAVDDSGFTSAWGTVSFICSPVNTGSGEPTGGGEAVISTNSRNADDEGSDDFQGAGDGFGGSVNSGRGSDVRLTIRAVPSLVRKGGTARIHWESQDTSSCEVSGENGDRWPTSGSGVTSRVGSELTKPIQGVTRYTLSCIGNDSDRYSKHITLQTLPSWFEI